MDRELEFRIVLEQPPEGVDFALQKGKGGDFETVQRQRSAGKDLRFQFTASVRQGAGGSADFAGPFVQGPARQRFVYIGIGGYAGEANARWDRRLKVPLCDITMKMIASADILETRVPGTGRDGSPACASVKDFEGWKAVKK